MLAQGQSSSEKRGGLAADVSSGLIFLGKKKKITETQIVGPAPKDSDSETLRWGCESAFLTIPGDDCADSPETTC